MESSARFPEIDTTDKLKLGENNQYKHNERSTVTWLKVFDAWLAERSEVRKLEDIPEDELHAFFVMIRKQR